MKANQIEDKEVQEQEELEEEEELISGEEAELVFDPNDLDETESEDGEEGDLEDGNDFLEMRK